MLKKLAVFSGSTQNEFGMPMPFHFYAIFVSQSQKHLSTCAVSVLAFSKSTPPETEFNRLYRDTSEEQALERAIDELKSHPGNSKLTFQLGDITGLSI